MSVETTLYTALKGLVSNRVYRDIAPADVGTLPRITFQQVGGEAINFLSGEKPSKKWARIQINCWDDRRDDVMALSRLVEDTLRAITIRPMAAAIAIYEQETKLYGSIQDFAVAYDD